MTLQPLPSEFPHTALYKENSIFLFFSVGHSSPGKYCLKPIAAALKSLLISTDKECLKTLLKSVGKVSKRSINRLKFPSFPSMHVDCMPSLGRD